MVDIALRAHNHNWRFDPIIRSLLDTDLYKFLMGQFIFNRYPLHTVTLGLKNRTKNVNLGKILDERELREQLDHVMTLKFENAELIWLQGNTFYGKVALFSPAYIDFLRRLKLPPYELSRNNDGDFILSFTGPWAHVTYWEIYALSIVSELKTRAALRELNKFELDILYARAKSKLWSKLTRIGKLENLNLSDMGTRRRHSFLWQEWAVLATQAALGKGFSGTSNAYLAYKYGLDAKGTNAHELPMALTAIRAHTGGTNEQIRDEQYEVLHHWQTDYRDNLLVALPDTFGTTQFLKNAPTWISNWKGFRPDSKEPFAAGEEIIEFWKSRGEDPKKKLLLFSDGLDVDQIIALQEAFSGRSLVGFGWGTNLTNDFKDLIEGDHSLDPLSLVCKVIEVDGHPAVKLSDNITKATGPKDEVERYKAIFGTQGADEREVIV